MQSAKSFRIWVSGFWLAVPVLLAAGGKPQHAEPAGPVVQIANGALEGTQRGNIAVFEGVPYAAAPVGALRWREPQPVFMERCSRRDCAFTSMHTKRGGH
jgi:hypothetical protein